MTWMFDHEDVEPWAATYLVYGLQLLRCDVAKQDFLPNSKEALAGWKKLRPGSTRLPVPEEFIYDIALAQFQCTSGWVWLCWYSWTAI